LPEATFIYTTNGNCYTIHVPYEIMERIMEKIMGKAKTWEELAK